MERLDKILASTGRWSRREVKELVRAGRVQACGALVKSPEEKFEREGLDLRVDGESVLAEKFTYLMLHKPAGLVSATEDPGRRPSWSCCRSTCGKSASSRRGGWTGTRRGCSCSPTTAPWPTSCYPPKNMWTSATLSGWTDGWTGRT